MAILEQAQGRAPLTALLLILDILQVEIQPEPEGLVSCLHQTGCFVAAVVPQSEAHPGFELGVVSGVAVPRVHDTGVPCVQLGPFDSDGDGFDSDLDCDDGDPAVHPDADEVCDGLDNDCDGLIDDETAADASTWYLDYDGDGFGQGGAWTTNGCDQPEGFVGNDGDCDDEDPVVNPSADELCNEADDDCDGDVDEEPVDGDTWYLDADGDGFGDGSQSMAACSQPDGWVGNGDDLDDSDPLDMFTLAGSWETLGNGTGHTGYFEGATGDMALEHLWTVALGGEVNQVAVVAGWVFATTNESREINYLFALDAETGVQQWNHEFEEAYGVYAPTWYDEALYVQRGYHGDDTQLWCFDEADGSVLWSSPHTAQWETYYAPAAADGKVWVNGGSYGGMYGFDAVTGTELFFNRLAQYDEWTPAWDDGVQPIVTDDTLVVASGNATFVFELSSGVLLDSLPYGGFISISDDRLFIGSHWGDLYAYEWVLGE